MGTVLYLWTYLIWYLKSEYNKVVARKKSGAQKIFNEWIDWCWQGFSILVTHSSRIDHGSLLPVLTCAMKRRRKRITYPIWSISADAYLPNIVSTSDLRLQVKGVLFVIDQSAANMWRYDKMRCAGQNKFNYLYQNMIFEITDTVIQHIYTCRRVVGRGRALFPAR